MHKDKIIKNNKADSGIVRSKPPQIFSIPRPYEDDYERNDAWYKKMQRLEVKLQELRQNFSKLSERQHVRIQETKGIIQVSRKLINNFLTNKARD